MSKEETPPGGLLSKMVRFVRNPTVNWTELDSVEDAKESQYSKQMLKEMIERKRRNDFVRRREFDHLRKLLRNEVVPAQRSDDPMARPSFFPNSATSLDERAVTLKKIDEIEAQMSQQWWKGKQSGEAPTRSGNLPQYHVGLSDSAYERAFAPTAVGSTHVPLDARASLPSLLADDSMVVNQFGTTDAALGAVRPPVNALSASSAPALAAPALSASVFAPVPLPGQADPLPAFVHDPDLEESAIRFANGDHAGAESGLLEMLAQHKNDAPELQRELWFTLFDLYRATGQSDQFEALGIDFAALYHRSAPLWFSMPAQLGLASAMEIAAQDAAKARAAGPERELGWSAPATLAVSSVAALQALLARSASPWTLSWARLAFIDEAAVPLLADQVSQWADREGEFIFLGVEKLNALLEEKTLSEDAGGSPQWWRLRMALLRLMDKPDAFEMVALDYCVTFEVSPPSWMQARCSYRDNELGDPSSAASTVTDSVFAVPDSGAMTASAPLDAVPVAVLQGAIDGDAAPALESFIALIQPGRPLVIACDQLVRVDFAAAGSILNWAAEQQSQGQAIEFHRLHRLVAVFFNVIGINEHARVVPRND